MNCDNQCCENKHNHYINDRYGINVTAMAHTQEPLVVEQAAELVPKEMRKPGTKITFWTFDGWQTWQFQSMDVREWLLPKSWVQDTEELKDIQNQIDSIQIGGWAISNQLGDDSHIGISQKALTELIGYDHVPDSIRGRIKAVENEIGTDTTSNTLSGRITSLESAVGTGGSIDARIEEAKSQVVGNADINYDTLGKVENKIQEEVTRSQAAEVVLDGKIDSTASTLNTKINTDVAAEKSRAQNAEELLRQAYEAISQFEPIIGTLPSSGVVGKVYRVPGTTSYSDYMWNGSQFVKMAEYDNAIDDEPIAGSDNLVKSGGVFVNTLPAELNDYGYIKEDISKLSPHGITSDGIWGDGRHWVLPVRDEEEITILNQHGNNIVFSFLSSYSYKTHYGDSVDYSSAYPDRIIVAPNVEVTYAVPSDCKYICFSTIFADNVSLCFPYIKLSRKAIDGIITSVSENTKFQPSYLNPNEGITLNNVYIAPENIWTNSNSNSTVVWEVNPIITRRIKVVNVRTFPVYIWFLKSIPESFDTTQKADFSIGTARYMLDVDEETVFDLPFDCKYICSLRLYGGAVGYPIIYTSTYVIDEVEEKCQTVSVVDYDQYKQYRSNGVILVSSSQWSNIGASYCIPIKANTQIVMTAPASGQSIYAFIRTNYRSTVSFVYDSTLSTLPANETISITSPDVDCYLYLTDFPTDEATESRLPKLVMSNIPIIRMEKDIAKLQNDVDEIISVYINKDLYNLNERGIGKDNEIWNWWFYPQAIETKLYRHKLIWGWCDDLGQTGVGELDISNGTIKRTILKRIEEKDDHNACFVIELPDGKIGVGYHGNHIASTAARSNILYIRKSLSRDLIDGFGEAIRIVGTQRINYAQCFYLNQKYYIFFRYGTSTWGYIVSDDFIQWSTPKSIIESTHQLYMKFSEVSDNANMLRICIYEHPDFMTDIKMGFFDAATGNILNSDNSHAVLGNVTGSTAVNFSSFNTIVSRVDGKKIRLFDVAVTPINTSIIAVGDYTGSNNDTAYNIVRNGVREFIENGGKDLLENDYPLGFSIIDAGNVVICRGSGMNNGTDLVEIYGYSNGSWAKTNTVFSERRDATMAGCRNAKPITSTNGRFVLWSRGFYEHYNEKFSTDAMIYDIENDKIY